MANVDTAVQSQVYDNIYSQAWEAVVLECSEKLESTDRAEAGEIKGASEFREAVEGLVDEYPNDPSSYVIRLLLPTVTHYEIFANTFVTIMSRSVDVSMLWGLLFLVIKISLLDSAETVERISDMLREIGNKIQLINKCLGNRRTFLDDDLKGPSLELNRDIVYLWLEIITIFRNEDLVPRGWENIITKYKETSNFVTQTARHFESLVRLTEAQSRMIDLAMLREHLPMQTYELQGSSRPCDNIPIPMNKRFFGRNDVLHQIGEYLQSAAITRSLSSVTLHGLHGVGKSQIALQFAYNKISEYRAVFWVSGETELSMQQSLSDIALKTLQLPDALAGLQQENSILMMHWLVINTNWLLIYDNITNGDMLEKYWPRARHGSLLITTNLRSLSSHPVDKGIEVVEFNPAEGAQFLVQSIPNKTVKESDSEYQAALTLSRKLGGHALGISQMAALIYSRGGSLERFLKVYENNEHHYHQERRNGWRHADYSHCLATLWQISFSALGLNERFCLGVLSFFMSDSIPSAVFEITNMEKIPVVIAFCSDDVKRDNTIERLAELSLIRYTLNDTLSIHRLVQIEFLFHIEQQDRQEAFDAAVRLLLQRFPARGESRIIDTDWPTAELYIQHALALIKSYHDSRLKPEPLRSSGELCNLICDVIWYLTHNDTANNLEKVLVTGLDAYRDWNDLSKDVLIEAYLLGSFALHDLDLGEFNNALTQTKKCLEIQCSILDPYHEQILNSYNNLGITYGSLAKYECGLSYLAKAEAILEKLIGRNLAKSVLINANMGRNYYCMGRYDDAEIRLKAAMADSLEMESWFWRVYIHFAFASLYCRTGDLDKAESNTELAKDLIDNCATTKTTILICDYAYRAGRVTLARCQYEASILHLEKAYALSQVLNQSQGNRARILFALSVALRNVEERRVEGHERGVEASRLRKVVQQNLRGNMPSDETFEAFDLLVRIMNR